MKLNDNIKILILSVAIIIMVACIIRAQTTQEVINAQVNGTINLINYRLDKLEDLIYTTIGVVLLNIITHIMDIKKRKNYII